MRVKLSDTNTTKLQPKKDPDGKPRLAELLDTEVAGLLVRVNEQGRKVFCLRARFPVVTAAGAKHLNPRHKEPAQPGDERHAARELSGWRLVA